MASSATSSPDAFTGTARRRGSILAAKGMSDAQYQLHNWYHFIPQLCGDHIVEQHVHISTWTSPNWAMQGTPVRVRGMGGRSNRAVGDPAEVGNIFDHFALEYEYANGVIVQSYCRQIDGTVQDVSEEFVGTKARVHTHPGTYIAGGKQFGPEGERDPYVQEHMDLLKAIRDNKPMNELEQVAHSTFTAIIGRMAVLGQVARLERRADWNQVVRRYDGPRISRSTCR